MLRHAQPTSPSAHKGRTLITLFIMLLTTATAWAETVNVGYKDDDGTTKYVDATVLNNTMNDLAAGWYVVNSDVTYSGSLHTDCNGYVNIILCDGATLTANNITPKGDSDRLRIYGQSQGTGTANISGTLAGSYSLSIYGGTINANILDGDQGSVGIIGGTVNVGSISPYGGVSFIGGNVIVTGEVKARNYGNIFLSGGTVKASSYSASGGYVYISKGLTYYDGTGASYTGTEEHEAGFLNLTSTEIDAIAGKTLRPYDYRGGTCGDPNVNEGKNVTWAVCDTDGNSSYETLIISGTGAMDDYGSSSQPWKDFKQFITSVTIGDGVTSIGSNAFYGCTSLAIVSGASGVTFIGPSAFTDTDWDSNLPNGLTTLGHVAYRFVGNGTSVTIPDGTTQIYHSAFQNSAITSIVIPASVKSIGEEAFDSSALKKIYVLRSGSNDAEITQLGEYAFYNCSKYLAIVVPDAAYGTYYWGWNSYRLNLKRGYTVTCGAGVTATTYAPIVAEGETVTLGVTPAAGYLLSGYIVNGTAIDGNTFTMGTADVTVSATFTPDPAHFSVNAAGTEYTIHTATGWGIFCDCLDDNDTWNGFSGKTVKLDANIGTPENPITRMAGSSTHDFCGTFDGGGNTLTVNLNGAQYVAPFFYVKSLDNDHPATIQNLKVSGTVTGSDKFAAGIAGGCANVVNITNCLVDVTINSSVNGDGTHGGLVGVFDGGTLNITGCAFTGKLLSIGSGATTKCGGFVGYSHVNGTAVNITNSLYAPAALVGSETEPTSESMTFLRSSTNTTVTITNSYYTRTLGDAQGKQAHSITAGENVTVANAGTPETVYTVSGITAYTTGIKYNDVLYAGSGDAVSLTLSNTATGAPAGYQYDGYTVSAGTLSGSTLTMPAADVTVSLALTVLPWSGDGSEGNPYIIYNKDQLDLLAYRVNGTHGETLQEDGYSGKYFKLNNDISYTHTSAWNDYTSDESNFEAIGGHYDGNYRYFSGHFDGNSKTISGIRIYKGGSSGTNSHQGIFGWTNSGADIHDLTIADARITGYTDTGGIVGSNDRGTVTRCHVAADVAVCAVLSNTWYHGGIVGYNYRGTIEQCTSAATLTDAYISKYYGGIAGYNDYGTLCDNLAIGATVPAAEDNTYGAITGCNYKGTLQRNYYAACKVANKENATGVGCEAADVNNDNNPDGAVCINTLDLAANQAPDGNFWTTYYNSALGFTIDADEHACAYTATYGAGQLTLHRLGKVIPKGTAVIIVGEDNSIGMTATTEAAQYTVSNDLQGTDIRKEKSTLGTGTFYVMGKVNGNFGFFQYTAEYMPARKAYLLVPGGNAAPGLTMVFGDEETNSLSPIPSPSREGGAGEWYTLDGRKLDKQPTQKGIYIVNGKKVVIN